MRGRRSLWAAVLLLSGFVTVAGCKIVGDDYVAPVLPEGLSWSSAIGGLSPDDLDPATLATWWRELRDPLLAEVVERAIEANPSIRRARSQLRQARAERQIAATEGAPTLSLGSAASKSDTAAGRNELYSASLDASWELDLFGGIARGVEAADAEVEAADEARRDVMVSVVAEVALNYVEVRTLQQRLALAEENLRLQLEAQRIVAAQQAEGAASELELGQAIANVESTRAQIPALRQGLQRAKNRLAVLLGQNPGSLDSQLGQLVAPPLPPARIAVGVPSQALRRRPDVRRSERLLAAATARVGVAIADLYPKLQLGGSIGLESLSVGDLFDSASKIWSFGPRAQWTFFDGGRVRASIEISSAAQEQALINYEESVLVALEDVENAIVAFTQEWLRQDSLQKAADQSARVEEIARAQYESGETDFLNVLDAQRARLSLGDQLAQSRGTIVGNVVRLYKALGGGWSPEAADERDD